MVKYSISSYVMWVQSLGPLRVHRLGGLGWGSGACTPCYLEHQGTSNPTIWEFPKIRGAGACLGVTIIRTIVCQGYILIGVPLFRETTMCPSSLLSMVMVRI